MTPQPCDKEVFSSGKALMACDTYECRSSGLEEWVKKIADLSKQRVDWHYSGGVAQVLYIGDRMLIEKAIESEPCPARIMKRFGYFDDGLYRNGVTEIPKGAVAGFYDGGDESVFMGDK